MPADDKIWDMFAQYVYVTVEQAQTILGRKFDYVARRLRTLHYGSYLGRRQENEFSDHLYQLAAKGADKAIERGSLVSRWYSQSESKVLIAHEKGITACQVRLSQNFPEVECRRWRADLQKDFPGDVPDLYFDLKDGMGWVPFEYVRENPVSEDKLREYDKEFKRAYIVLPTVKRIQNLFARIDGSLPSSKLWFTSEELFHKDITGKIWWTPKNYAERQYSILKPEAYT